MRTKATIYAGFTDPVHRIFWRNDEMNANTPVFSLRFAIATLLLLFAFSASALAAKDDVPKTTHDGLDLVEGTKLRVVYMKPGASLAQYKRVSMLDCYVAFKKNWQRDYNRDEIDLTQQVRPSDMKRIKDKVAREFKRVFTKELETKGGYQIVDESVTGDDVLIIRPAIINLDVTAPDTMSAGFNRTFTANPGQMTLYIELYDSVTNSIIARAIDPQAARGMGRFQMSNSVTNTADADRILRKWADILRSNLGDLTEKADK